MKYEFIGWCKEGAHDKVWVCVQLDGDRWGGSYATIWGRRGKKLQHKVIDHSNSWDMEKLINSKVKKGYKSIQKNFMDEVYPEFDEDLQKTTVWALLKV